jgi:hypothetical protein
MPWYLSILQNFGGYIAAGIGLIIAFFFVKRAGKKEQALEDLVATQEEVIHANEDRSTVEDRVRRATPSERDGLREPWTRD